jgi:hypothetical protein
LVTALGATDLLLVERPASTAATFDVSVDARRFTKRDFYSVFLGAETLLLVATTLAAGLTAAGAFFTGTGATDLLLAEALGVGATTFFTSLMGAETFAYGFAGAGECLEARGSALAGLDSLLEGRASGLAAALGAGAFLSAALASRLRSTTGSTTTAPLLGRTLCSTAGAAFLGASFLTGAVLTTFATGAVFTGTAVLLLEGLSTFLAAAGVGLAITLGATLATTAGAFWRVVLVSVGVVGVNCLDASYTILIN